VRCVFVLDIFNGAVVHALRGERSRYEAVEKHSKIVSSSDPLEILKIIRPKEVYIADLNRLTGCKDSLAIIEEISGRAKTMADIGILKESDLGLLSDKVRPNFGHGDCLVRFDGEGCGAEEVSSKPRPEA